MNPDIRFLLVRACTGILAAVLAHYWKGRRAWFWGLVGFGGGIWPILILCCMRKVGEPPAPTVEM